MRLRWIPSIILPLALIATACQPGVAPLSEEDVAAIKAVGPALDEAALAGDWSAIGAMFTEDALVLSPNAPAYQGRSALLEFIESAQLAVTRHIIEFPEVDGYGDIAYARGTYDEAFTTGGTEDLIEDVGKIVAILRKQADGSWLIANWITNSDLPLPSIGGEHLEGEEHN